MGKADKNTNYQVRQLRKESPPGKLVDVGGHRLHIYCLGEGSPAVVLDAGQGVDTHTMTWYSLQPEIARLTRFPMSPWLC